MQATGAKKEEIEQFYSLFASILGAGTSMTGVKDLIDGKTSSVYTSVIVNLFIHACMQMNQMVDSYTRKRSNNDEYIANVLNNHPMSYWGRCLFDDFDHQFETILAD